MGDKKNDRIEHDSRETLMGADGCIQVWNKGDRLIYCSANITRIFFTIGEHNG